MQSRTYDRLKWVALVLLPAMASTYFALGQLWNFPNVEQVVGTITILDTFLGLVIGKSSSNYRELTSSPQVIGNMIVYQDPDGVPSGNFKLEGTVENVVFEEGRLAGFKIKRAPEPPLGTPRV